MHDVKDQIKLLQINFIHSFILCCYQKVSGKCCIHPVIYILWFHVILFSINSLPVL